MDEPLNNPQLSRKVLCIEDEFFISELYERALTKSGYGVTVIANGDEALTAAQTDAFDIILLDLIKALRTPNNTSPIKAKIIIITNLEQREDARKEIEQQADGYLVKAELTPRELVEYIDKVK
jgi:DNA-binding response OmpR family regulator